MNFIAPEWIAIGSIVLMMGMSRGGLPIAGWILPVIPIGVLLGYLIVQVMRERYYIRFIYLSLFITSILLIYRAITDS